VKGYDFGYLLALAIGCTVTVGVAFFGFALARALRDSANLIDPAADQAARLRARPARPGEFEPDLAWPLYPFHQGGNDLAQTRRNVGERNGAIWSGPLELFFVDATGWWWVFPVPVSVLGFLLLVSLVSWACFAVYAVVNVTVRTASYLVVVALALALRGAEYRRRSRVLARAACMHCFHVADWPAFRCPGCEQLHHDLTPGRLGLLFRRCQCGTHLPTLASRATWQVRAVCQRCELPLLAGTGAVKDIRIPVFGNVSAGKTRLIYASLRSLMVSAGRAGLAVEFPDEDSKKQAKFGLDVITSGRETAKTSTNMPVTLTVRLGSGRTAELLHLFDAAGEDFDKARRPDGLRFLDDSQGLIYVLDPFSIEAVRRRLDGDSAPLAALAAEDPQQAYTEVVGRLQDGGVPASRARIAVVVSKADLLRTAGLDPPVESAAIARWLRDVGAHNLAMAAERDFSEARFFTVASQDIPPDEVGDPGAPVRWLLTAHGSQLPAVSSDVRERVGTAGDPEVPS
jgi:hypothetical protein